MTPEQENSVIKFMKGPGARRIMQVGPYLDGFSTLDQTEDGKWTIKSQVWAERPLLEIPFDSLRFFNEIYLEG